MANKRLKFGTAIGVLTTMGTTLGGTAVAQQAADYPPNAEPGNCYARVWIPEVSSEASEQVVDIPESTQYKAIPAIYDTVTESITVKEASVRYETVPATYKTVTEQVLVEPERIEKVVVPAQTETYEERVLVREAYVTWKPGGRIYGRNPNGGAGLVQAANISGGDISGDTITTSTGEILCRVEVPAEYNTVTRTRIVQPERTVDKTIPARYETVTRQVIATPATTREVVIPAVTETRQVQKLITPAREEAIVIPATYKTVTKRVVTKPGGLEWRSVLCDQNASADKLAEVQRALTRAGYATEADGQWGNSTLNAMERFQRARGLPVGYLTIGTLDALGVRP